MGLSCLHTKDDKKAKRKLEPTKECRANNANLLFELVRSEWGKLINTEFYHQSLLESIPQRLQKVIDAGGRWTGY